MKFFNCASALNVRISNLRLLNSPLNIHSLIFIVLIDGAMAMSELKNGYLENVSCTNKTRKILLLICMLYF